MTPVPPSASPHVRVLDPYVFGTVCGLLSAVMYTASNAFLRAAADYDPFWVSAVKAFPTVVVLGPLVAVLASRDRGIWPTRQRLAAMVTGGLVAQLGGNVAFQWSLGEIGVALAVPLSLGGMIVAAAILGRVFLYEPVTPRALLALGCLLAAIFVLSLGADEARRSVAGGRLAPRDVAHESAQSAELPLAEHADHRGRLAPRDEVQELAQSAVLPLAERADHRGRTKWRLAAGVAAACGSGLAYAVLNVILRYQITRGASLPVTLFVITLTGTLSLGTLAWLRIGADGMLATTPQAMAIMLAAGICNTAAFASLTKSLQLTSVVYVNALNATQATLAALAGVLIFREALSPWLTLGVGLTIAGLMLLARAHRARVEPATS